MTNRKCLLKLSLLCALCAVVAIVATGCNSETVTEPVIGADGKPIYDANGNLVTKTTVTKESPLRHKTFSTAGSVTALDVKSSTSADGNSSATPHVTIGGTAGAISSSAVEDDKPTFSYAWSAGIFKSITSSSATSGAMTYVGVKGETAEQTQKRLTALQKMKDGTLTESASPDSAASNEVAK